MTDAHKPEALDRDYTARSTFIRTCAQVPRSSSSEFVPPLVFLDGVATDVAPARPIRATRPCPLVRPWPQGSTCVWCVPDRQTLSSRPKDQEDGGGRCRNWTHASQQLVTPPGNLDAERAPTVDAPWRAWHELGAQLRI